MRRNNQLFGALGLALSGTALLALSTEAWSQVAEIVVTTRKREENLQEIPVAVEAITAEQIERQGITSLSDVVQNSSSVILDQGFSPQDQRIVIRGLSPTRGRQNAAVLIDDIDISSEAIGTNGGSLLINPQLFDLERVEIVKGPQNALYGRSAFAGAINYITKKPSETFEASAGADIGSDGQLMLKGGVSGPVADGLTLGINAMTWSHDGFYTNTTTNQLVGGKDGDSVAGTLVWKPADSVSVTGRVEYLNDHFDVTPYARADYPSDSVPNPNLPQFNYAYPVPFTAATGENVYCNPACPGGTYAPVIRSTFPGAFWPPSVTGGWPANTVLGQRGELPDGDDLVLRMGEDPRTCNATYPASLAGCDDYAGTDREITRGTLNIEWDAGPVTLRSLSHLATADTNQEEGPEDAVLQTDLVAAELHFRNTTDLFSQELRLLSNSDGPVTWAAGTLFWQERTEQLDGSSTCISSATAGPCGIYWRNIVDTGLLPLGASIPLADPNRVPLNPALWERETTHFSVYGLVEWQFLEQWKIAVEGRQTYEELQVQGPSAGNGLFYPGGIFPFVPAYLGPGTVDTGGGNYVTNVSGLTDASLGNVDDDFFAPKATLTWTPTAEQLYYFSWGESFKPEGITPFTGGAGAFDPVGNSFKQEKLVVWELGTKTSWFDGRLLANGAAFFQDFKNKQVGTQVVVNNTLVPRTINAGVAEVWGAELELTWVATDNLSMSLAYTWLDTEYTEYLETTTSANTIVYEGNCIDVVPTGGTVASGVYAGLPATACVVDHSGNELEGAPEHSLVGSARYQHPLVGGTDWFVEGNFEFQDDRYQNNLNTMILPSYWMFDFRAGVSNDSWDVIAYVDNAFDDDTIKTGFADGDVPVGSATGFALFPSKGTVILPDPRTYGLRVNYRFGGE